MTKTKQSHWTYKGTNFNEVSKDVFGFVYRIESVDRTIKYIGKKQVHTWQKGRGHRESNWRRYTSSSTELKEIIKKKGTSQFKFEIIELCYSKIELTYNEMKHQVLNDVLHDPTYLNKQILGRFYKGRF